MRYIGRRLLYAVFVIWAAYTITWLLLYALPGDPIGIMLAASNDTTPETRAALEAEYGLDKPPILQYFTLLFSLVTGDFGTSIQYGRPVVDVLFGALPHTVLLGLAALVVTVVVGFSIAILANTVRSPWLRNVLFTLPPAFLSFPIFLTGLLFIQIFAFQLHLLPAVGNEGLASIVLPAVTAGVPASAAVAQVTSKALSEYLRSPQAAYLRARGLGPGRILVGHALRNAIIPAVTILGMEFGGILAGAVITETVFSRQGLGRVLQAGVLSQDIPVVMGVVLFSAVLFVISNLVVDLVYPWLDPRIRKA